MAVVSGYHSSSQTIETAGWMAYDNNSVAAGGGVAESKERKINATGINLGNSCIATTIRCKDAPNGKDSSIRCHDAEIVVFVLRENMMIRDDETIMRKQPARGHSAEVPVVTAIAFIDRSDHDNCWHHALVERLFSRFCGNMLGIRESNGNALRLGQQTESMSRFKCSLCFERRVFNKSRESFYKLFSECCVINNRVLCLRTGGLLHQWKKQAGKDNKQCVM